VDYDAELYRRAEAAVTLRLQLDRLLATRDAGGDDSSGSVDDIFKRLYDTYRANGGSMSYEDWVYYGMPEGNFIDNPRQPSATFGSQEKLIDHFKRHGSDFGAKSPAEYEQQASAFLTGPLPTGAFEKTRPNGDLVRYNPATEEFGVLSKDGVIRTYFKPDPAIHGYPTNLDYYNAQ